jgi:hypothetical protein
MSDLTAFLRQLRRRGYSVRLARSGHWHVRDRRGRLVAIASGTTSDRRSLANLRANLRRAGREPDTGRTTR